MESKAGILEMYGREGRWTGAALLRLAVEHGGMDSATAEAAVRPALWRAVGWAREALSLHAAQRPVAQQLLGDVTETSPLGDYVAALAAAVGPAPILAAIAAVDGARAAERAARVGTCWRSWGAALVKCADVRYLATFPEDSAARAAEEEQQIVDVIAAYGGVYMWRPLLRDVPGAEGVLARLVDAA